jgi:hypothetical protein
MDFHGPSIFIGSRDDGSTASWPAWSRTVADDGGGQEQPLAPVSSYAEAERLVQSAGAERLFVPAEVLADMVGEGVGPRGRVSRPTQ